MASPANISGSAVYEKSQDFGTIYLATWRWVVLAFVGVYLLAPVFVDRNLNDPHITLTVILGSMMIAFAASKIITNFDARGVRVAFAVLGALFAVLPFIVPEQVNPLGAYHTVSHLLSGAVIISLSLWHISSDPS